MRIALATGSKEFDEVLQQKLRNDFPDAEFKEVYYREFLIDTGSASDHFDLIIVSPRLDGAIDWEEVVYTIRSTCRNTRIIMLLDSEDEENLNICLKYGIYDILFDSVSVDDIRDIIATPRQFADIAKYVKDKYQVEVIDVKSSIKHRLLRTQKVKEDEEKGQKRQEGEVSAETVETDTKVVEKIVEKVVEKEKVIEKEKVVEKPVLIQPQVVAVWSLMDPELTANFATALAQQTVTKFGAGKGALLDFDEITSQISNLLKCKETNIDYLVRLINRGDLTTKVLEELLQSGNLKVFCGINVRNFNKVRVEHLVHIIQLLRRTTPFIVVNAGSGFSTAGVVASFAEADKIIVLVRATRFCTLKTLEVINFLELTWGLAKEKVHIFVVDEGWTSEFDGSTIKEISERNGINYLGCTGKNYQKAIPKLVMNLFGNVQVNPVSGG